MNVNEFPLNPSPGQLAYLNKDDGSTIVYEWDAVQSAWVIVNTMVTPHSPIFSDTPPTVYPPDQDLRPGDIWYDTSDPNGAVMYVWNGSEWILDASLEGILHPYATTAYVDQQDALATAERVSLQNALTTTQQDLNVVEGTYVAVTNALTTIETDFNVLRTDTQQDVALAATAVDAKFDMLRVAVQQATDFATLKARLLAVLQ